MLRKNIRSIKVIIIMKMVDDYINFVIKPTEKIRNDLQMKIIKKGIFASKDEKEYLEKYDELLMEQYITLERMMME